VRMRGARERLLDAAQAPLAHGVRMIGVKRAKGSSIRIRSPRGQRAACDAKRVAAARSASGMDTGCGNLCGAWEKKIQSSSIHGASICCGSASS